MYRPFLNLRNSTKANNILLKENEIVITEKKRQIAETFKEHFVHIADVIAEVDETLYGLELCEHPGVKAIWQNNEMQHEFGHDCELYVYQ